MLEKGWRWRVVGLFKFNVNCMDEKLVVHNNEKGSGGTDGIASSSICGYIVT